MTHDQRELVHLLDDSTSAPAPEVVNQARAWLSTVLTSHDACQEHLQLLAELYKSPFTDERPVAWPGAFPHWGELPPRRANEVLRHGPNALAPEELRSILLDPLRLYELNKKVHETIPDWAVDSLAAAGRELIDKHGLKIPLPSVDELAQPKRQQNLAEILVWADGTADTEAYWSERRRLWCFIDWLNHGDTFVAESWIEMTLNPAGLPGDFQAPLDGLGPEECGLNQRSVACDLEAPGGRWVVDAGDFTKLQDVYGDALVVTRRGTNKGLVIDHG